MLKVPSGTSYSPQQQSSLQKYYELKQKILTSNKFGLFGWKINTINVFEIILDINGNKYDISTSNPEYQDIFNIINAKINELNSTP